MDLKGFQHPKPYALAVASPGEKISLAQYHFELTDQDLPENSVAVVVIDGPVFSWNTMDILMRFQEIRENDRIISVLFMVNSPGGMITGVDILSNLIRDLGKPVVAMTIGMTASAAAWMTSGATRRIATSPMDLFGSIGMMTTMDDFREYFKKLGIKHEEIFATKSTLKNKEDRAFQKNGDTKPMLEFLDKCLEFFHQAIITNLGIKADSEVLSGDIYFAQQALDLGLIDEIGTMDGALEQAYSLGLKNKAINQFNTLKF